MIDQDPGTLTLTIPIDTAVSNAVQTGQYVLAGLQFPSAWTAASVIVQGSDTIDGTFHEIVKDSDGTSYEILAAANRKCVLDAAKFVMAWPYLRLQSVTISDPSTPVNQGAERTILMHVKE